MGGSKNQGIDEGDALVLVSNLTDQKHRFM